jgi:hypothetical protein
MAPEVLMGGVPDAASDQFGLAASLLHVATGQTVYGSRSLAEIFDLVRGDAPPKPPPCPAGTPPELAKFLERGLAWEPTGRLPNLGEVRRLLRGEVPIERHDRDPPAPTVRLDGAPPPSPPASAGPRPRWPWALAAILVSLAWLWPRAPAPAPAPSPTARIAEQAPDPAARWAKVEQALEAVRPGHAKDDGEPAHPWGSHLDAVASDLGGQSFPRRVMNLYQTTRTWLESLPDSTALSEQDRERFLLVDHWLTHLLADLEVQANQGSTNVLREVTADRDLLERVLFNQEALSRRAATALGEDWPRNESSLQLAATLLARLPVPGKQEYLERTLRRAEETRGPRGADLASLVRHAVSATRTSPGMATATRLAFQRRVLPVQLDGYPPPRLPYQVENTARTIYGYLRIAYRASASLADEAEAGLRDMVAGADRLITEGGLVEVRAILQADEGKYLVPDRSPGALGTHPTWQEGLAELRRLIQVE